MEALIRKHYYSALGEIRIWEQGEGHTIYQAYDIKSDEWVLLKIENGLLFVQWAYVEFWILVDKVELVPVDMIAV